MGAEEQAKKLSEIGRFPNDSVTAFNPVTFSIAFVAEMRRQRQLDHVPSLRTTLAIPRFLTARYFRLQTLGPRDYIDAAVLNTPYEDQSTAEQVARRLLFPPSPTGPAKKPAAGGGEAADKAAAKPASALESLIGDLESLNMDFESLESLDDLFETEDLSTALGAYDLFEELLTSSDPADQALAALVQRLGGPGAMEVHGAHTRAAMSATSLKMLLGALGTLEADTVAAACTVGFADELCRHATTPWELAAALAGAARHEDLRAHVTDQIRNSDVRTLGKILRYLRPFPDVAPSVTDDLRDACLTRARDLGDWAAFLDGIDEWIDPPDPLLTDSARSNFAEALQAADWLKQRFDRSLHTQLFNAWADSLAELPDLPTLVRVAVPCARWERLLDDAYDRFIASLAQVLAHATGDAVPEEASQALHLAAKMSRRELVLLAQLAGLLSTDVLCVVRHPAHFLPLLDEACDLRVVPKEIDRVLEAAQNLGIDAAEVYRRLGDAVKQLTALIEANQRDAVLMGNLVVRVVEIDPNLVMELAKKAEQDGNMEGLAAMVALNLGAAAAVCTEDGVVAAFGFKGIGGGPNLLKQWYDHSHELGGNLRARIKRLAHKVLVELSIDLASRGGGSMDQGMIPRNEVRPFRASDELDLLDVESTLDNVIGSGKALDQITDDDLFVHDTARGQAALLLLIDISGSMSGGDLATCAMAVIMLLARLRSEEVAMAVFESNTHVLKRFDEHRDMEEVANQVLDLRATGGTCVDAALTWTADQFAASSSEFRLLFLVSDFCFSETTSALQPHASRLADLRVACLAASHSYVQKSSLEALCEPLGGEHIHLKTLDDMPQLLNDAINNLASRF